MGGDEPDAAMQVLTEMSAQQPQLESCLDACVARLGRRHGRAVHQCWCVCAEPDDGKPEGHVWFWQYPGGAG